MASININEEQISFYLEIGLALTQFKFVSDHLFNVLQVTVLIERPEASEYLQKYVNATSFGSQLAIAKKFLPELLPKSFHDEWLQYSVQLETAKEMRNNLAHGWLLVDTNRIEGERIMMLPTSGSKWDGSKSVAAHAAYLLDVVKYRNFFFSIGNKLQNLDWRLRGEPKNYPDGNFAEPTDPTLHEIIQLPYMYLGVSRTSQKK